MTFAGEAIRPEAAWMQLPGHPWTQQAINGGFEAFDEEFGPHLKGPVDLALAPAPEYDLGPMHVELAGVLAGAEEGVPTRRVVLSEKDERGDTQATSYMVYASFDDGRRGIRRSIWILDGMDLRKPNPRQVQRLCVAMIGVKSCLDGGPPTPTPFFAG